jgi:hypothetical protein
VFVVYLEPRKGARPAEPPYKAFSHREAAEAYASDHLDWAAAAEVWVAPGTEDPADAVAAVRKLKS